MTMIKEHRMRLGLAGLLAALLLLPAAIQAAETAETILIRAALSKDLNGRRRSDTELALDAYDDERFVAYDAGGSTMAVTWTPTHGDRETYGADLEKQLTARRYDILRQVVFINVWKDKAFVTTIDSGFVQTRPSGERTTYFDRRLWTFAKQDDEWLATGVVSAFGDTTDGALPTGIDDTDVAQLLRDEAAAWTQDSPSGVASAVSEEFVAVESHESSNPAKWLIVFADRDEYREWLDDRLERVDYTVEREVVSVNVGAGGAEAVAVTRDRVRAAPRAGDVVYQQERLNYWLLSKTGGSWKVEWVFWKSKDLTPGSTAALH